MSERLVNPFENYTPPALNEIFSAAGKLAVVEFKSARVAEEVKELMLRDRNLANFLEGNEFSINYDCHRFEPYLSFPSQEDEMAFISQHVISGVEAACIEYGVREQQLAVRVNHEYSEDDPGQATLTLTYYALEEE